jgi:NuA3 HAT complex component NTO1
MCVYSELCAGKAPLIHTFQLLQRLRKDLESVRVLAELSRKRESRKLKQAEIVQDILSKYLFPHENPLRLAFERIMM